MHDDGCCLNKQFHFCEREIFDLDVAVLISFANESEEEEEILQCSRDIILNAINLCERDFAVFMSNLPGFRVMSITEMKFPFELIEK